MPETVPRIRQVLGKCLMVEWMDAWVGGWVGKWVRKYLLLVGEVGESFEFPVNGLHGEQRISAD